MPWKVYLCLSAHISMYGYCIIMPWKVYQKAIRVCMISDGLYNKFVLLPKILYYVNLK